MSAATTTSSINNQTGESNLPVERRCENADCNASKLLSMVPKRKTSQFVVEPNVMEKPMLINGFTTVFQIDGPAAKLSDVKNVPSTGAPQPKTIYRIVPNTHAHIVNYVVVDAEGESLRKINESDPATMRKLLESQKVSADQMLKKLIAGVNVASGGGVGGVGNNNTSNISGTRNTIAAPVPPVSTMPSIITPIRTSSTVAASLITPQIQPQIQLPVRMHPNLKITAVASAETVGAMNTTQQMPMQQQLTMPPQLTMSPQMSLQHQQQQQQQQAPPTLPLITPVPLSSLQSPTSMAILRPASVPVGVSTPPPPSSMMDTVEKPVFDKMQAELQELRRTVAMLAEAQAKNQQQHQQVSAIPAKRLR